MEKNTIISIISIAYISVTREVYQNTEEENRSRNEKLAVLKIS